MAYTQDEKAALILDKLFLNGKAVLLKEVKKEFEDAGIPGCVEYIRMYGAHITRRDDARLFNQEWVYKYDMQRIRIEEENKAVEIVSRVLAFSDNEWSKVRPGMFRQLSLNKRTHTRISEYLKTVGMYVDEAMWDKFRIVGGGIMVGPYRELLIKDRLWIFDEIKNLTKYEAGSVDADEIWDEHGFILKGRVTRLEFDRCVELINMYETFDEKTIYGVEL